MALRPNLTGAWIQHSEPQLKSKCRADASCTKSIYKQNILTVQSKWDTSVSAWQSLKSYLRSSLRPCLSMSLQYDTVSNERVGNKCKAAALCILCFSFAGKNKSRRSRSNRISAMRMARGAQPGSTACAAMRPASCCLFVTSSGGVSSRPAVDEAALNARA
eukprot:6172519-Pleurochrysis_carterae.AAC.2